MKNRTAILRAALVTASLMVAAVLIRAGKTIGLMQASGNSVLVIAHRAGAALGPENTLAALERSIVAKADMAEVDVRLTRDGVPILLHDSSLTRTTGWDREAREASLAELAGLDAGAYFSTNYSGEPIPTLEQALLAARGRIRLMLDLKPGDREELLVLRTAELIQKLGMERDCVIASSSLPLLQRFKTLVPQAETAYITDSSYFGLSEGNADSYSINCRRITSFAGLRAHGGGRWLYAWTANTREELRRLLALGVDGLITDNPALAVELLTERC